MTNIDETLIILGESRGYNTNVDSDQAPLAGLKPSRALSLDADFVHVEISHSFTA